MSFAVSDPATLLVLTTVVTLACFSILNMFGSHDPREPPLAPQRIPLIGHMVGLARSKFNYYVEIG
ncbi:hypothetical protein E5D57_011085 [Metarhizium anisopliae]|nr:hypothetical protein E5D57_011085 [Metarhizium anisopliae]